MSKEKLRVFCVIVIFVFLNSCVRIISFADGRAYRVDVPTFKQTTMPWAKENLGFSEGRIEDRGCALLCASMVLKYYGVDTDPLGVNNWLKANGGFIGGNIVWSAVGNMSSNVSYLGKVYFNYGINYQQINQELDNGYPVIAELSSPKFGMHFVVLTGYKDGDYYINDGSFEDTGLLLSKVHENVPDILKAIVIYHGPTKPLQKVISYSSKYEDKKSIDVKGVEIPDIKLKLGSSDIEVNTFPKNIESAPAIDGGRTYIPLRSILEEVGGRVEWNEEEQKTTVELEDRMIEMWMNKKLYYINGWYFEFDTPPKIINGRMMIPLRGLFETIGFKIGWDKDTQEINISSGSGISSPNKIKVYTKAISPKELVKNYIGYEEQKRYSALSNFISQKGFSNIGRSFDRPVIGKEYLQLKKSDKNIKMELIEKIDGNTAYVGINFYGKNGKIEKAGEKIAVKLVKSRGLWYLEDKGNWYYPK